VSLGNSANAVWRISTSALWILALVSQFQPAAHARTDLWHYAHNEWTPQNSGLRGIVHSIAQTSDGYMWFGTDAGLFRFDGVRMVSWMLPSGRQLPNAMVTALLAARDGTLWIGTHEGLVSWRNDQVVQYPALANFEIQSLIQARDGTVWVGGWGNPTGTLCAIRDGASTCYGDDGSLGSEAISLYEDPGRRLWVAASSGLWRWQPGPPTRWPIEIGDTQALARGVTGSELLFVERGGIRQFADGKSADYVLRGAPSHLTAKFLLWDRRGALWIGTDAHGLAYVTDGSARLFTHQDGLTSNQIMALFEDREGILWVATSEGVDSLRELPVASLSVMDGLSSDSVRSVLAGADGSIWIGTATGLNRWKDGRIRIYRPQTDPGLPDEEIEPLCEDERGHIWVTGRYHGIAYFENGKFTPAPSAPQGNIISIAADGHGGIWLSLWHADGYGLVHWLNGKLIDTIPWRNLGGGPATGLVPDESGGVWAGLLDGGVVYYRAGQIHKPQRAAANPGAERVLSLVRGNDGVIWAGTQNGVSRIANGRVATLTTANGLPCNIVHWIMEDSASSYWLYTDCGLLRIARTELNAWIGDPDRKVAATTFDSADGIQLRGVLNYSRPVVTRSSDGRIWFENGNKLAVIDPSSTTLNMLPPPVHVEEITAEGKSYHPEQGLRLPALIRNLAISYTALSLAAPEKVRFRYKLEGQDPDWREVVNERKVQYSNLPPSTYRFRVTASNNNGVWNEQGASLDFSIAPAYWQTTWFRALCVAAVLALFSILYWLRLRQLAHEFDMKLEARVDERTRVARELHDTLLQSFNALLLRFRTVHALLSKSPDEARQVLESALDQTRQALTEGRQAVQGLRHSEVETQEFTEAVRTLAEELASDPALASGAEVRLNIDGTPRPLRPYIRDEIYRIASEALRNALRHAGAVRIEVQLAYGKRRFELRVRDDGKGIDPRFLCDAGLPGHFGLRGMRERAQTIGGEFKLWSAPASGTELALSVPAALAYGTAEKTGRSWLARKTLA
jgi:signal transduction histidine kinase/ligand-binding sensor domain-containing protein